MERQRLAKMIPIIRGSMIVPPNSSSPSSPWRREILKTLLNGALVVGGVLVFWESMRVGMASPSELSDPSFWAMLVPYFCLWGVRFAPLSDSTRAWGAVAGMAGPGLLATLRSGLLPGPTLSVMLAVLVGTLLLGRTALFATLGLTTLAFLGIGLGVDAGFIVSPTSQPWSADWYSGVLAYCGITGLAASLVHHVVTRLERALLDSEQEAARAEVARDQLVEAEQKLIQSQKLEALGLLAGGVAHDFNNTLQVIQGWADLLVDEPSSEDITEAVSEIGATTRSAAALTRKLLTFGRRQPHRAVPLDLVALVESWAGSLSPVLRGDQRLMLELSACPEVEVDPRQLEQILLNLVANARDASSAGGTITIGARAANLAEARGADPDCQPSESWVRISVKDEGEGMDSALRARIFEPFYTTKGDQGTGLGLSAVYGSVRGGGGHIGVQSGLGEGSTFEIFFPANDTPAEGSPLEIETGDAAHVHVQLGARVLLAEDDPRVRRVLSRLLRRAGCDVVEVSDGDEAWSTIDSVGPGVDLLCVDGVLAGRTTREVIDHFLLKHPEGSVLVCSGHVRDDLVARRIDSGELELLQKPFTAEEFETRLARLLN